MKHMNILVTLVVAAAVLVAAYGVGLLVRHTRSQHKPVIKADDPAVREAMLAKQRPGGEAGRGSDPNAAAQLAAEREKMQETMKNMTDDERRRVIEEQVRNEVSTATGRRQSRSLSAAEREKTSRKWQNMTEDQKKAFRDRTVKAPAVQESPAPSSPGAATTGQTPEPGPAQTPASTPEQGVPEAGKAGQG